MKKRENKFRAWDDRLRIMFDGDMIEESPNLKSFLSYGVLCVGSFRDDEDFYDLTLLEFTGFRDKNGKDIFEGDIVCLEKIDGVKYVAQVRFFNGAFCIYTSNADINVTSIKGHNVLIHIDYDWEEYRPFYEVIGNIYENKDLLKSTYEAKGN